MSTNLADAGHTVTPPDAMAAAALATLHTTDATGLNHLERLRVHLIGSHAGKARRALVPLEELELLLAALGNLYTPPVRRRR
jgi:hypothetical protein